MRECSYGEISNEFFANFPVFWTIRTYFGSHAHGLGELIPAVPQSFACAQAGQRKHHQQLAGVLVQTPVTRLVMPEMALEHPKRMLHLDADTGFDLFNQFSQGVAGFGLVQRLAFILHHSKLPVHTSVLVFNLLALFNASAARVGKDRFFLSMQQGMLLRQSVGIGRRCRDRMHQARVSPGQCSPSCQSATGSRLIPASSLANSR